VTDNAAGAGIEPRRSDVPGSLGHATAEMRRLAGPFIAALELTRQPMVVTDPRLPDNPIVFTNRAFLALTGYDANEILGSNCRFLQGPDTDPASVALVRNAVAGRREVKVQLLNYRKDGGTFWNELYLSPVFDEAGELVNIFASLLDVTPLRQGAVAQERLAGTERRLADAQRQLRITLTTTGVAGTWDWDIPGNSMSMTVSPCSTGSSKVSGRTRSQPPHSSRASIPWTGRGCVWR
jgi:PAS domain S-box-containing protein